MNIPTLLLIFLPIVLFVPMLIQGIRALRNRTQDGLTLEEGLEAVKRRIRGREYLRHTLAAGGAALLVLSGLAVSGLLSSGRTFPFFGPMAVALCVVVASFLLSGWLRRVTTMQAARRLERAYATDAGRTENLSRMLRTYFYYKNVQPATRPALFRWVRKEAGLFLLGLDIKAHFSISAAWIVKRMALLTLTVLLLGMILSFSCRSLSGLSPLADRTSPVRKEGDPQTFTPESVNASKAQAGDDGLASRDDPSVPDGPPRGRRQKDRSPAAPPPKTTQEAGSSPGLPAAQNTAPEEAAGTAGTGGAGRGALARLLDGLKKRLSPRGDGNPPPEDVPAGVSDSPDGGATQARNAVPGAGATQGRAPVRAPSGAPAGRVDAAPQPPAESGEGASGRARISRGGGGNPLGGATTPPEGRRGRALLRLEVGRKDAGAPRRPAEDTPRPRRYNAALKLDPEDVTATPADPLMTQRIPRNYRRIMKRLLTRDE